MTTTEVNITAASATITTATLATSAEALPAAAVELSVVLRVVAGGQFLRRCLTALLPQVAGNRFELVVPFDPHVSEIDEIRRDFPQVRFVSAGDGRLERRAGSPGTRHELYDRRTAAGFLAAHGAIIASLEDYQVPAADWCQQIVTAHRLLPHAVIGGCVEHGGRGPVSWAAYFLDYSRYQPPLPEGPVEFLTDVNLSYKRPALFSVRPVWEERYNEVNVHWALLAAGHTLWRRPQIVARIDRGRQRLGPLIVERFYWGRLFSAMRVRELSKPSRAAYALLSPGIALVLLWRIAKKALGSGRTPGSFVLALPSLVAITSAWSAGECVGYLTGREGSG